MKRSLRFILYSEAWYAVPFVHPIRTYTMVGGVKWRDPSMFLWRPLREDYLLESIDLQFNYPTMGFCNSITIDWVMQPNNTFKIRVEDYDQPWRLIPNKKMVDLLETVIAGDAQSPQEFAANLLKVGASDDTSRTEQEHNRKQRNRDR
jgi:hypothetical protein